MQTVTAPRSTGNVIVRYAIFHGAPGYGILTPDRRVLWVDHDAQCRDTPRHR